jgi:hypothetical protein
MPVKNWSYALFSFLARFFTFSCMHTIQKRKPTTEGYVITDYLARDIKVIRELE